MDPSAMAVLIDVLMVRLADLELQTKTLRDFHTFQECRKSGPVFAQLLGSKAKSIQKHYAGSLRQHVLVSFDRGSDRLDLWAFDLYDRFLHGEFTEVTTPVIRGMILALETVTYEEEERPHWRDVHSGVFSPHTYVRDEIVSRIVTLVFPQVVAFDALLRKFVLSFDEPTDVRKVCQVTANILEFLGERVEENSLEIYELSPELARISDVLLAGDFVRDEEEEQFWYEVAYLFQSRCLGNCQRLKRELEEVLRAECGVAMAFGLTRLKKLWRIITYQDSTESCA